MNEINSEYILNFTIPAGATGSTGPTGPSNIPSMLSHMYNNTSTTGLLTVNSGSEYSIILPESNSAFQSTEDTITILKDGYYVFSLSGTLMEATPTGTARITLNVGTDELITVLQNIRLNEMHFAQTKMKQCRANERVTVRFDKASASNTSTERIYLLITQYVL